MPEEIIKDESNLLQPTQYDAPKEENILFDTESGKVIDKKDITPWQIIQQIAKKINVEIKDKPKKDCRKCYGRGYIGVDVNTKMPIFCSCIFKVSPKEDQRRINPFNRSERRRLEKFMYKRVNKIAKNPELVKEINEEIKDVETVK